MKQILSILAVTAVTASSAFAQVTGPSYDFDKLDALWSRIAAPDSSWYSDLRGIPLVKKVDSAATQVNPADTVNPPAPTPTPTPTPRGKTRKPLPDVGGVVTPPSTPGTDTTTVPRDPVASYKFPVLAPIGPLASDLYAKNARIDMYLAAERYFSGLTMTPQEEQGLSTSQKDERRLQRFKLIKQRALSASLELYLMKLSRYYDANKLSDKCREIRAADQIYTTALVNIKNAGTDLLPEWNALYSDYKSLIEATQGDSQRFASCNLLEVNSKGEAINKIKDIVSTAVSYRLQDKVAKEIAFFQSQTAVNNCAAAGLSDLQKLSCMGERLQNIQLPVEETFDLARQVRDVKANLDLVSFGYPAVKEAQAVLREKGGIDVQGRLKPGVSQPFPKLGAVVGGAKDPSNPGGGDLANGAVLKDEKILALEKAGNDVSASLGAAIQVMVDLHGRFRSNETAVCANLLTRWKSLELTSESAKNLFVADFKTCVTKMSTVVNQNLNASDSDRFQSIFLQDLSSISKVMLDSMKSSDSSDNGGDNGGFDNF